MNAQNNDSFYTAYSVLSDLQRALLTLFQVGDDEPYTVSRSRFMIVAWNAS
jgi:hypothetical protein